MTPENPACETCGKLKSEHRLGYYARICPSNGKARTKFHRAAADMPRRGVAPHVKVPLGRYQHYKGGYYVVTGGAYDASDECDTIHVAYTSEAAGFDCVRDLDGFLANVLDAGGFLTPRFKFIGANTGHE